MRIALILLTLLLLSQGCSLIGEEHQVKTFIEVKPSKLSVGNGEEVKIKVKVENIASSPLTANVDANGSEGLFVVRPERTTITLKPEESRIMDFSARIKEDALPGSYVVDIFVETDRGDVVREKAKLELTE